MGAYLFSVYRTAATPPPATNSAVIPVQTAPAQDEGRSFATLSGANSSVSKGNPWSVRVDTNTWATCLVDLYQPDEKIFPLDKEAAKASFVSPGKFIWTWNVPADAVSGTWVARVICGTYENLATSDQAVEVR